MATFEDVMRGRVDVSRLEESRGWLGAGRRDPGEDPPDMAGLRLTYTPAVAEEEGL